MLSLKIKFITIAEMDFLLSILAQTSQNWYGAVNKPTLMGLQQGADITSFLPQCQSCRRCRTVAWPTNGLIKERRHQRNGGAYGTGYHPRSSLSGDILPWHKRESHDNFPDNRSTRSRATRSIRCVSPLLMRAFWNVSTTPMPKSG